MLSLLLVMVGVGVGVCLASVVMAVTKFEVSEELPVLQVWQGDPRMGIYVSSKDKKGGVR